MADARGRAAGAGVQIAPTRIRGGLGSVRRVAFVIGCLAALGLPHPSMEPGWWRWLFLGSAVRPRSTRLLLSRDASERSGCSILRHFPFVVAGWVKREGSDGAGWFAVDGLV